VRAGWWTWPPAGCSERFARARLQKRCGPETYLHVIRYQSASEILCHIQRFVSSATYSHWVDSESTQAACVQAEAKHDRDGYMMKDRELGYCSRGLTNLWRWSLQIRPVLESRRSEENALSCHVALSAPIQYESLLCNSFLTRKSRNEHDVWISQIA
jgi:hypothetical protein